MDVVFQNFMSQTDANALIVIGQCGCGKTSAITQCLQPYNYLRPKYDELHNHESVVTIVTNFLTTRTMMDFTNREKVIFFDDVDILMSQDRYANKYIQEVINSRKCKVICTCSSGEEKRVVDIKKISLLYKYPLQNERGPYYDKNIYDIVSSIFERCSSGIVDIEHAISSDVILIGYILYDNYRKYLLENHYCKDEDVWRAARFITSMFSDMSRVEDCMFISNDYNIIELATLCKAYAIRLQQNTFKKKRTKNVVQIEINYTQIASRSAQQHNIQKKLRNELYYSFDAIGCIAAYNKRNKIRNNMKANIGAMSSAFAFNVIGK